MSLPELEAIRDLARRLRQPMACTHPRACWQATKPESVDAVVGYRCTACEHECLAVEAALRMAASIVMKNAYIGEHAASHSNRDILALIHSADAQALDAHDAEVWNEALATFQSKSEFQFNYWLNQGHAPLGAIRIAMDTVYRALKREKRGGKCPN